MVNTIQSPPLRTNRLYGRNTAQVVACTVMTVPIVRAPFETIALHKADPEILSAFATTPLPKPPASTLMSQQYQNGFGGSCSEESIVARKVKVPKHQDNFANLLVMLATSGFDCCGFREGLDATSGEVEGQDADATAVYGIPCAGCEEFGCSMDETLP